MTPQQQHLLDKILFLLLFLLLFLFVCFDACPECRCQLLDGFFCFFLGFFWVFLGCYVARMKETIEGRHSVSRRSVYFSYFYHDWVRGNELDEWKN